MPKTVQDYDITSVVLPVEDIIGETRKENLVSSLKEEFEMGVISKSFVSRNALQFAVSMAEGSSHGRSGWIIIREIVCYISHVAWVYLKLFLNWFSRFC